MNHRNETPVSVHKKTLAQVGTRSMSATTVAHTNTLVIQTAGRSGVERYRSPSPAREERSLLSCVAIVLLLCQRGYRNRLRGRAVELTQRRDSKHPSPHQVSCDRRFRPSPPTQC